MHRSNPRADVQRLSQVLAGCTYPAAKWQLIMQAEDYGADAATRAELWGLPVDSYPDLRAVLVALGVIDQAAGAPVGHRAPSAAQATRTRPSP